MTFRQQFILTVLDKGLLALIVAVAGYSLTKSIEAFKGRQALENDLAKARDQKQLELLQSQLSQFYWPVYLRLQMDNVVWERLLQRCSNDHVRSQLGLRIEKDFILPNHEATSNIIEANIHLAAPESQLMDAILKYLRHVAVYRALRAGGNDGIDPIAVGELWPGDVFPAVREATLRKQRDFEALLKQRER